MGIDIDVYYILFFIIFLLFSFKYFCLRLVFFGLQLKKIVKANDKVTSDADPTFYLR